MVQAFETDNAVHIETAWRRFREYFAGKTEVGIDAAIDATGAACPDYDPHLAGGC